MIKQNILLLFQYFKLLLVDPYNNIVLFSYFSILFPTFSKILDVGKSTSHKTAFFTQIRSLHKGIMGSDGSVDLGVQPNKYDAVICVGVLVSGHVKGEGMNDFLFVVKAGGLIVFNINESVFEDSDYKYHEKMEELSKQGKWKLLLKTYERKYNDHRGAYFYIYQKIID